MPFTKGHRKIGGRSKGGQNKATREIKDVTRNLFDAAYWKQVQKRLQHGDLSPAVEVRLLAYAFGEPKQAHEISGPDGGPITVEQKAGALRALKAETLAALVSDLKVGGSA